MELKILTASQLNPPLNITVVKDLEGVDKLAAFLEGQTRVGFDTETNIEKFFYRRYLRTVQLGNKDAQFVVDMLALCGVDSLLDLQGNYGANADRNSNYARLRQVLKTYLESNRILKVGHNLLFDYITIKWCLGIRPWHLHDTQLTEHLLEAGIRHPKDKFTLEELIAKYLSIQIDKSKQKSFDLVSQLTQEQIEYAAVDTRLPIAVMQCQLPRISSTRQAEPVQIENDALPAFGDLHLNGLLINEKKWLGLVAIEKAKHVQHVAELDKYFIPVVGLKKAPVHNLEKLEAEWRACTVREERAALRNKFYAARREVSDYEKAKDKMEGEAYINYGSQTQLLDALRKMGFSAKKLPDTDDRSLKKLHGEPVIDALRNFRETNKVLTTYGEGFLDKYISPVTGRIHSDFDQLGAATGRSSSLHPNVQNILNGSDWRSCFIARPGHKIITCDYNGCELRILAELSQEGVWVKAFKKGWDVHSVGAEILYGEKWEAATEPGCIYKESHQKCDCKGHKKLRKNIKSVNFGIAYGMEARKLSEELGISLPEAEELMSRYKRTFAVITAYLDRCGKVATQNFESRTMSGRRRRYIEPTWEKAAKLVAEDLPAGVTPSTAQITKKYKMLLSHIQREGKNTPIQGTNGDIIKLAMGCGFDEDGKPYLWHILEPMLGASLLNMVHDELLVECKDEGTKLTECFEVVKERMEKAEQHFLKTIPAVAEAIVGGYWIKD